MPTTLTRPATPPAPPARRPVQDLFRQSCRLELRQVTVVETDAEVVLIGRVSRYYFIQLAVELARPECHGRTLLNRLMVTQAKPRRL